MPPPPESLAFSGADPKRAAPEKATRPEDRPEIRDVVKNPTLVDGARSFQHADHPAALASWRARRPQGESDASPQTISRTGIFV